MSTVSEYEDLLVEFRPRPIQSAAEHRRACKQVAELMSQTSKHGAGKAKSQMIELLSTLIESYESTELPTPNVSPRKMLAHCIESRGVSVTCVARESRISQSTISNVLAGRRGISSRNALKLAKYFHLPVTAFLSG